MKTETITIKNTSGTEIQLSFDAANLLMDARGIGLRIPVQFSKHSRVVILHAFRVNYPTAEVFLARVEQFGKQQVADWLQSSSDTPIVMPFPDMTHGWGIDFEETDEPKPKKRNA